MLRWTNLLCAVLLLAVGCRKAFVPTGLTSSPNKYLVIDGIINSGGDSTIIMLSRTQKIDSNAVILPETGARLVVESDGNNTYNLIETTPGTYAAAALNLDVSHKYRLHIKTTDNEEYLWILWR